jgi:hypothetical protein
VVGEHLDRSQVRIARVIYEPGEVPVELGVYAVDVRVLKRWSVVSETDTAPTYVRIPADPVLQVEEETVVFAPVRLHVGDYLADVLAHEAALRDEPQRADAPTLVRRLEQLEPLRQALLYYSVIARDCVARTPVVALENHRDILGETGLGGFLPETRYYSPLKLKSGISFPSSSYQHRTENFPQRQSSSTHRSSHWQYCSVLIFVSIFTSSEVVQFLVM